MEENKDFLNWYKAKITENLQDPPEDAWNNIADELDTNDVWEKISVKLDDNSRWFTQKSLYYALPLLLLLITGGLFFYFDKETNTNTLYPSGTEEIAETDDKITSESREPHSESHGVSTLDIKSQNSGDAKENLTTNKGTDLSPETPDNTTGEIEDNADEKKANIREEINIAKPRIAEKKNPVVTSGKNSGRQNDAPESHKDFISDSMRTKKPSLENSPGEEKPVYPASKFQSHVNENRSHAHTPVFSNEGAEVGPLHLPDSMLSVRSVLITIYPDSLQNIGITNNRGKLIHHKTIEFGITASLKNTWLLNRTTFAGLEKHTLNTTLPDFGKDIGIVFSYNFSPKLSAQAEGMFISEMGQKYKEYRNGKYVNREVDLHYYNMNLLLKYSRNKIIHGQPINGSRIIGGLYAGRFKNASETINDKTISTPAAFSNYNLGVILGYEYNRYLFTNLVVTSGLRINYGFSDIRPHSRSKTATGSFDLNIAIKYRIGL